MSAGTDGSPEVFRVLFVCTGNICRSPFAQFHTRFLLGARLGPWARAFAVHSAGTSAVRGHGMHDDSRAQLTSRRDHPDVAAFAARQLPDRDVLLADLVLTMTREHRSTVLGDVPKALPTTFTLREFARLLRAADPADVAALPRHPVRRAHALVALARGARGTVPAVSAEEDAVPDPVSGGPEAHEVAARAIDESLRVFLDLLAPPPPVRPLPPRPAPPGMFHPQGPGHAGGPVRRSGPGPVPGGPPVGPAPMPVAPPAPQQRAPQEAEAPARRSSADDLVPERS
jgi:protein-tyrosine-phosphatase